jgi:hypothetical protein
MKAMFVVGMLAALSTACGGASKPPLQPDSDSTSSLGDGGPEAPAAPAQPAAPASSR